MLTYRQIASFAHEELGMNYVNSVNLVIIVNGVGVPARILPGYIADRFTGVLNVFLMILCMVVLLAFSWLGVSSITGLYAWTVIYGMCAAGFQSLFPTVIASLGDDITKTGTRLGMAFSVVGFAALVGGPIGGALIQADGGRFRGGMIWAALNAVLGTALVTGSRVTKYGWRLKKKC
jgi:MFS family permease